jgi:hypothetical protein
MSRCTAEQINAADYFRNALCCVVDDHSQVVSIKAIASPYDKIADIGSDVLGDGTLQTVDKAHGRFWNAKA